MLVTDKEDTTMPFISPINWLNILFSINALMLQNFSFATSWIRDSQYSSCITLSGFPTFFIMIWHMLCGWSRNVSNFFVSILFPGQVVWCMTWLILILLHSSWVSFFSFCASHSSLVALSPLLVQFAPCLTPLIVLAASEFACLAPPSYLLVHLSCLWGLSCCWNYLHHLMTRLLCSWLGLLQMSFVSMLYTGIHSVRWTIMKSHTPHLFQRPLSHTKTTHGYCWN